MANSSNEKFVEVKRSDLIYMTRAMDVALAEIEAAVGDGDVKEEVLLDLEHAYTIMEEYLGN